MQLRNGHISLSPSDVTAFLACEHLTTLQLRVAQGELKVPPEPNEQADIVFRKGLEHEQAFAAQLRAGGKMVREIALEPDLDWERAQAETLEPMRAGVDVVYQAVFVDVASGVPFDKAKADLTAFVKQNYPSVNVSDQAEFKQQQLAAIDQVFAIVYVLLLLSVIISLFGIVNTLGLSIYERVRELGLLRAVGMSRRQVKRMIRVEAVIIAVLGAVLGLAIGILFGWAMQRALSDVGIDRFAVPAGQLVAFVVVAALLGVLAAVFPARRAAKLNVLEAISYE